MKIRTNYTLNSNSVSLFSRCCKCER